VTATRVAMSVRALWMASATLTCSLILSLASAPANGANPAPGLSARDMMEKNFLVSRIKSWKSEATMVLINDKGQTRERKTTTFSVLQPNGIDSKLLVRFSKPADIQGTAFLQVEHIDGDDDQWIYLPALGKSRRLVANNKKDSFVGSDFSYGDLSQPKAGLFEHRLLGTQTIDGQDCYMIESVPKSDSMKSDFGYSRKITWLRPDNFLETKVEYYDLSNRLLKTQLVGNHKLLEPATQRWVALHREMTNQQTGHRTVFNFDNVESGIPITDDLFTTRYLERE
jgi:outer membrane lipoprotein-sorting protein